MEQIRMKRAGLGLRGHNPALAYQGYTYWVFRKRITRASIPQDILPLADSTMLGG